jgi:hypothetical protein
MSSRARSDQTVRNRRVMPRLLTAAAAVVTVLAVGESETRAQVISVNVVGGQTDPGSGGAGAASVGAGNVAGVARVANWNDLIGDDEINRSVVDSTGAAAAVVNWSVNNTWAATGTTPATPDARMMNGYLDNLHSQAAPNNMISVTNLGSSFTAGGYDVIVYQNSDSAGSFGYTVADNAGHTDTRYGRQLTGAGGNYPLTGPDGYVEGTATVPTGPATAANYVRIRGLTGSSFTITGLLGTTGDGRARPNGFQVVAVPEPTALGLLGLGALACSPWRRVRRARSRPT